MHEKYPILFSPIKVGNVIFPNRIFVDPHNHSLQAREKGPTDEAIKYYANKAKGGAGAVICGSCDYDPEFFALREQDPWWNQYNLHDKINLRYFVKQADTVHFYGARAGLSIHNQFYGGWKRADYDNGRILYGPADTVSPDGMVIHATPYEEMRRIYAGYCDCAENAVTCGYDFILLYGFTHGGLGCWLSKDVNTRTDEYGGPIANRARFICGLLDAIRERIGDKIAIGFRMDSAGTKGFPLEDMVAFAQLIEDKIDFLNTNHQGLIEGQYPVEILNKPKVGKPSEVGDELKKAGYSKPLFVGNGLGDPADAEKFLEDGHADVIAHVRQGIADPDVWLKAKEGREDEIVPCILCTNCHNDHFQNYYYSCSVNPLIGRENVIESYIEPPKKKKKVAIVGGGPAGMEAAITAVRRGHEVWLYEKRDILGGNIRFTDLVPFKEDLRKFKDFLISRVYKEGVKVLLSTEATEEVLKKEGFDAVLAAVGAKESIPDIPGLKEGLGSYVIPAGETYDMADKIGERVVIIGGGLTGCDEALYLAWKGKKVTLLSRNEKVAPKGYFQYRIPLLELCAKYGVDIHAGAHCISVSKKGAGCRKDGKEEFIEADTVILALGMKSKTEEAERFRDCAFDFQTIGDSWKVGAVKNAVRTGFDAAVRL